MGYFQKKTEAFSIYLNFRFYARCHEGTDE